MRKPPNRRARIQYIHDRISGKLAFQMYKYNPGYASLAEELGTTAEVIEADAAFMRDELGLPVEYDRRRCLLSYRGGWHPGGDLFNLADSIASRLFFCCP